jgi:vancomycin resistance protein YoaR
VLVLVLLVGIWALATRTQHDRVARNVSLAGHDVGGNSPEDLARLVDQLATDEHTTPIHIATPTHSYDTTAGALGLTLDPAATTAAVLDVDRSGSPVLRPFRWAASWFGPRKVPPRFGLDRGALIEALPAIEGENRTEAVEPTIAMTDPGAIVVTPGTSGHGLDPDQLADALLAAAPTTAPGAPIEVHVTERDLAPRFSDATARTLADEATQLARRQLSISVEGKSKQLDVATVASWMRVAGRNDSLVLTVDPDALNLTVATLFGDTIGQPAADASFTIEDGKPVLHPSHDGTVCCEADAGDAVLSALRDNKGAVALGLIAQKPVLTTEHAQQLGIVEEVGQPDMFGPTTRHACCEGRVTNIHKIADIVRGHVILPGDTFSVNEFVGKRTKERGFVDAPVIYNGTHAHDIGGGVSQFATTTFNAAFFAGLDISQYQSHSLYISRYPRGREATISWPAPDLKIMNSTPYGVLLWPTYDGASLTVHVYSTHFVDVEAGPTTDARSGRCTKVTTPRTRSYLDGHVAQDKFFALYQPADGVKC